jgi:hypothetical protein
LTLLILRVALRVMVKKSVVLLLVAALLLTATPAALSVEGVGPSVFAQDDDASGHSHVASTIPVMVAEVVDGAEAGEGETFSGLLADGGPTCLTALAVHLRVAHARDAYRSRVPAVAHGLSPPGGSSR